MNLVKNILESGFKKTDSYQDRRGVALTNCISLILFGALLLLMMMRLWVYHNFSQPREFAMGAILFLMPIILNRFFLSNLGRLIMGVTPTVYIWYFFMSGMVSLLEIPLSVYEALRVYLLAMSCIPYLTMTNNKWYLSVPGILTSFISIVFFEGILNTAGVGISVLPGSDAELMPMRFVLCYFVINGGCLVLQSVVLRNDRTNKRLITKLQEKSVEIESQNHELVTNRNQLNEANSQLERLLEQRTQKISAQQKSMLSYAHANSHHVRGPVARLLGVVELYKVDKDLDCKWLVNVVDHETRALDMTIRKISADLDSMS